MNWRAWHIFIADRQACDRFLLDVVAPEAEALSANRQADNWFFIRYWENGPHIRFRIKGADEETFAALGSRLREAAARAVADAPEAPREYSPDMRFDGWQTNPSALPWFDQGAVHEIMYEPEYRRYGGVDGLEVSEVLFNLSSRTALKVLAGTLDSWPKREALALRLTAAAIMTVARDLDDLLDFLRRMASAWLGFAPDPAAAEASARADYESSAEALARLFASVQGLKVEGEGWPPLVALYARAMENGRRHFVSLAAEGRLVSPLTGIATRDESELQDALKSIAMSHVHMTNNRLGMSPMHEYRFAQMLLWASQRHAA